MKDRLYLLKPNFHEGGKGPYFCPGCSYVEGMLSFYPALRDQIEIHYIDFPRPRSSLAAEIGTENQGCPKLILGGEHPVPPRVTVSEANGRRFVSEANEICRYLAGAYGFGEPHD